MDGALLFRWLRSSLYAYARQPFSWAPLLTPSSYYCASSAKMRSSSCGVGLQCLLHDFNFLHRGLYPADRYRQEGFVHWVLSLLPVRKRGED